MLWTQRDQIQAYQFLRRRLVSALVSADANSPVSPSRRLVAGVAVGVGVALLVTAGFGVAGVLSPTGDADWKQGGQVLVEKETGARFVLGQDGLLHPVLNYASARLLAGGNGDKTTTVPASTLAGAARGHALGIAGAPDSLPAADHLLPPALTSCSWSSPDAPTAAEPVSTVLLGVSGGGRPLAPGQGLLVRSRSGDRYLIASGRRYRLPEDAALTALGYDGLPVLPVAGTWVDTVPAGQDLGLVSVPDSGASGPTVGGRSTRVGQVLSADNGVFYLVRKDSLATITQTEARLVVGNPANTGTRTVPVSTADIAAVPRAQTSTVDENAGGYPRRVPAVDPASTGRVALCAAGGQITLGPAVPLPAGARTMPVPGRTDDRVANEVYVPPGSGALVNDGAAVYLVTDTGTKYPVSGADAVKALGYGSVSRQGVSTSLLSLLPTGPALDPRAAQRSTDGG
ncbi:type VII secretion protein EccB [Kutzneria viridogrisea]|uniref:type VII secretion protein EccB n=1 Tax=Kutzneria viridogrisea TaxID=47990 RepID=UPI00296F5E74